MRDEAFDRHEHLDTWYVSLSIDAVSIMALQALCVCYYVYSDYNSQDKGRITAVAFKAGGDKLLVGTSSNGLIEYDMASKHLVPFSKQLKTALQHKLSTLPGNIISITVLPESEVGHSKGKYVTLLFAFMWDLAHKSAASSKSSVSHLSLLKVASPQCQDTIKLWGLRLLEQWNGFLDKKSCI